MAIMLLPACVALWWLHLFAAGLTWLLFGDHMVGHASVHITLGGIAKDYDVLACSTESVKRTNLVKA